MKKRIDTIIVYVLICLGLYILQCWYNVDKYIMFGEKKSLLISCLTIGMSIFDRFVLVGIITYILGIIGIVFYSSLRELVSSLFRVNPINSNFPILWSCIFPLCGIVGCTLYKKGYIDDFMSWLIIMAISILLVIAIKYFYSSHNSIWSKSSYFWSLYVSVLIISFSFPENQKKIQEEAHFYNVSELEISIKTEVYNDTVSVLIRMDTIHTASLLSFKYFPQSKDAQGIFVYLNEKREISFDSVPKILLSEVKDFHTIDRTLSNRDSLYTIHILPHHISIWKGHGSSARTVKCDSIE